MSSRGLEIQMEGNGYQQQRRTIHPRMTSGAAGKVQRRAGDRTEMSAGETWLARVGEVQLVIYMNLRALLLLLLLP